MALNTSRIFVGSVSAVPAAPASQRAQTAAVFTREETQSDYRKIACRSIFLFISLRAPFARRVGGREGGMSGSRALTRLIDTHECSAARGQSSRKRRPGKHAGGKKEKPTRYKNVNQSF